MILRGTVVSANFDLLVRVPFGEDLQAAQTHAFEDVLVISGLTPAALAIVEAVANALAPKKEAT